MQFPLTATVSEVIHVLQQQEAQNGRKAASNMKLYIRERGQGNSQPSNLMTDRMLQGSERPIAIQSRRLLQAGFTEAEEIENLGKEDLAILCKFIYQTPVLPIMDPV
jgi:adenylate cyclase